MACKIRRGNSYRFVESCGYTVSGQQVTKAKTWQIPKNLLNNAAALEKEAMKQLFKFEDECKQGQAVTVVKKFEAYAEEWLEEIVRHNQKKSSYDRLVRCTKRIYPVFGHLRLDCITPMQIQEFINSLSRTGANEKNGKPLAPKTIRHYHSFISCVFSHAVDMRIMSESPCKGVKVPKIKKQEKPIYSEPELKRFLESLKNAPLKYRVFFTLMVHSGARRGEILGLMYKDIDWKKNKIKIKRTALYTPEMGDYTDTPKTEASRRTLNFSPEIMDLILELQAEQEKERKRLGGKWTCTDRLFTKWNGEPMNYQTPYEWLQNFSAENGLPCYGIHQFRHLFASMLIHKGVNIVRIARMLGHENTSVTLTIYSHEIREAEEEANDEPFIVFD